MPNIAVLDQSTINQIAAGEVIERPAAVVKELIENAIDAGSNAVTVEIKEGGISFIRITDNGMGIKKDEIPVAFLRHSTSKIKSIEDLFLVSSLGFRGEALSSIAAVSQVELVTKTADELNGVRYLIEGGEEKGMEEIGCPDGTTFIIRNLFFHTPARRKFLKSPMTEAGYISDLVERMAVSHPDISFKFILNNQIKLHTNGNNNLKDIIYHVYGREITANLIEINADTAHTAITGYIGKPIISRGNRNYMNYFINGRYIKSSIIHKAIEEAYKPYTMTHKYPFTAIHFTIDSSLIDVNVHPAKMEIRFTNGEEIYQIVYQTMKEALSGKNLIPDVSLVKEPKKVEKLQHIPEPFEKKRIEKIVQTEAAKEAKPSFIQKQEDAVKPSAKPKYSQDTEKFLELKETSEYHTANQKISDTASEDISDMKSQIISWQKLRQESDAKNQRIPEEETYQEPNTRLQQIPDIESRNMPETKPEQLTLFEENLISDQPVQNHKILGQLFSTYWVAEYQDKMYLIDQHAAHEKVLYEKTMKSIQKKEYLSQMIQPPIILTLNLREEEALKKHLGTLNQIGFEMETFGGMEYSVRAVPADLFGIAEKDLLIELIDSFVEDGYSDNPDILMEKVASMSCKAAVKGNHRLSVMEAESLIDDLLKLDNPYHCPHGRPIIISMSKYEIEKKFKRII